jgi:fatty acid desaturase
VARFVARWQAWLFFPLLTLEGFNLHVAGVRAVLRREDGRGAGPVRRRWPEAVMLAAHLGGYLVALFAVLPPGKAVAFLLVHQALFGLYLGGTFAPNHKGMPTLTGDRRPDFLRRQVLTSRNVRGGRLLDVLLGGLNHQIEHHLFPHMPTPNLRQAQPIVRAYCAELGVPYESTGLLRSYAIALRHLHEVGAGLRR